MRASGILLPVFSLASAGGIGGFSKEAYEFIDFLNKAGQSYWQILPIGPTGFGNSPYQPFSAFAGNPYFIGMDQLVNQGLLEEWEVNEAGNGENIEKVDYGFLYNTRFDLLKKAFYRFEEKRWENELLNKKYLAFLEEEKGWLEDYACFMSFKEMHGGKPWYDWEEDLKKKKPAAVKKAKEECDESIRFIYFQQFEFEVEWVALRTYALSKQVQIIGDMPFYVSLDSADVWAHPEVFQLDKDLNPKVVAGCAPDAFSATGQLWGNPIYDWAKEKKNGYVWWKARLKRNYELYDVIRFDHFHGFSDYYAVPYGDKTAEHGKSCKGPGMDFFTAVYKELGLKDGKDAAGNLRMIAEDLGTVTKENVKLLKDTGMPGMSILEYAFTSWNSIYLSHCHERNSVVYTGTHDNAPVREWLEEIQPQELTFARKYINSMDGDYGRFTWDMIREAYHSVADICIIPLQDYLVKGKEARINTPGSANGNWEWRLLPNFLSDDLAGSIHELSATYGRLPKEKAE